MRIFVFWLLASVILILLDRIKRTGRILTALGLSCAGGALTSIFVPSFAVSSASVTILSGLFLYTAIVRSRSIDDAGALDTASKNYRETITLATQLAPFVDSFLFHFVTAALIISVAVASGSASNPGPKLLAGISGACGVLAGILMKRRCQHGLYIALSSVAGLVFGGGFFTLLIASLRFIFH